MVLPAAIAGGAIIGGGIMSYLAQREASKLNAQERARLQALLNKVKNPKFDYSELTPEDYQLVGTYVPQAIPLIEENAPQLVELSEAGQKGKTAQLQALQRLMEIGSAPRDIAQQAAVSDAARAAAIQSQGSIQALQDRMARTGAAPGSGMDYATALSQLQANQQQGAMLGQNAALDAYKNRLNALMQGANLGSQVQANEQNRAGMNADIINAYNQRLAQMRQSNVGTNIGNQNQAAMANLNARQSLANMNVQQQNEAQRYNQQYLNSLRQQQYDNALKKIGIQAGASQQAQQGNLQDAQNKANLYGGIGQGIASAALFSAGNNNKSSSNNAGNNQYQQDMNYEEYLRRQRTV